jgi:hypothetical protein
MKFYHSLLVLSAIVFVGFLFLHGKSAFAQTGIGKPFGGLVILSPIPGVTCTGIKDGPFVTLPASGGFGPFVTTFGTKMYDKGNVFISRWLLGRRSYIPDATLCSIQVGNAKIPFPVFVIDLTGTS